MNEIIEELREIGHADVGKRLEELKENMIFDMRGFKRELERVGLKTKALEEFINNYMRWDNLE